MLSAPRAIPSISLTTNLKRAAQNSTEVSSLKMLALNTNFLHYSQKVPMKVIAKST